jgi:hypothetical protein
MSTSAAKLSFPADGLESGREDLADAAWKDRLADTSDVTLTTGTLAIKPWPPMSKDRASQRKLRIFRYFR